MSSCAAHGDAFPLSQAKWLWPELAFNDVVNCFALFRREFELIQLPESVECWITADQSYQLYLNGQFICRGPARGYQSEWPYDRIEVSKYLHDGVNCIAIRAYQPGRSTFAYRTEGYAGILAALVCEELSVVTDEKWKCIRQPGYERNMVPYSVQLNGCQESIDTRLSPTSWTDVGFDDSEWLSSQECRLWNAPPYDTLIPRGTEMMEEGLVSPPTILATSSSQCHESYKQARNLAQLRYEEGLVHDEPSVSIVDGRFSVLPVSLGQYRSYLIDFGRMTLGSLEIEINGATGGEYLDFYYAEIIDNDPLRPVFNPDSHSRVFLADRLVCREGRQVHHFYHPKGFRYLTLSVRDAPKSLEICLRLRTCNYPLGDLDNFECSDSGLQSIWDACAHTQRICSMDAYVDTPWREQAQWWGDARVQSWNTFQLSSDARLLRRGIEVIAGQATSDGLTYGHAPTIAHDCVLPDFSLIWILTLWDYYWQTGEVEALEAQADRVEAILNYFKRQADNPYGLVQHDPRYWLFLDWTEIQREGYPAMLTLWLIYTLQKLSELCRCSEVGERFSFIDDWTEELVHAALKHLITDEGLVCDGLDSKGQANPKCSLQCQTLAMMCALPEIDQERMLSAVLLPWVRGDLETEAQPSSYWCVYPLQLLADRGHGLEVLEFIRRRWAGMAEFGTTWETFAPLRGCESYSHAWSAHPLFLIPRILAGVRQIEASWKKVICDPMPCTLSLKHRQPTPLGDIVLEWNADGTEQFGELSCPKGIAVEFSESLTVVRQTSSGSCCQGPLN